MHMMSPHSRHAVYGQRSAPPQYYYDPTGAYPPHYIGAYYPPPPGTGMSGPYYDPNAKY